MPSNAKQYREHLYRTRNHPESVDLEGFTDRRDSLWSFYLSLIPFLGLEYFVESYVSFMPSALVFPTGYLLFWSFYYSFYQPGILEEHLSEVNTWDPREIPVLILGVLIWFLKLSAAEFGKIFKRSTPQKSSHRIQRDFYTLPPKMPPQYRTASAPNFQRAANPQSGSEKKMPPMPPLPPEVLSALAVLGLSRDCRNWELIHTRYRALAKMYHPDLNREITDQGNRFMACDSAYRRLARVKTRFFN